MFITAKVMSRVGRIGGVKGFSIGYEGFDVISWVFHVYTLNDILKHKPWIRIFRRFMASIKR